jgi:N-acetyl sugar amidotransferase
MILNSDIDAADVKVCSRCIYDERVSAIVFDDEGVCNYCKQIDDLTEEYGTGKDKGSEKLESIIESIKTAGKGKKYDCIIGVSGGTDSSYMVYLAIKWGLRPLAVHYDNTWNSAIATENIRKVLTKLNVDLYTHVVNNKESDDIFRSFFMADVAEIDAATDLAFAEVAYRAAAKYGVKYVFEGHSFITEGVTPLGRNYFDGKYIKEIHKRFGKEKMKSYPLMTFSRLLYWSVFAQIRKIRPFWYMDYNKEDAMETLKREFDWKYYGGHHLENRLSAYFHSVYAPQKFKSDFRNNTLSALVRLDKISRKEAWSQYNTPPKIEDELVSYFQKRIGITQEEYARIMQREPKDWRQYPTYKKRFERFRPLFFILAKTNLVPMSFYLKYCFPSKV